METARSERLTGWLRAVTLALSIGATLFILRWLDDRDRTPSGVEARVTAEQRADFEREQRDRGLVEVKPARPLPPSR